MQHPEPPLEEPLDVVNDFYQAPIQGEFTSQEDVAVWPLVSVALVLMISIPHQRCKERLTNDLYLPPEQPDQERIGMGG